MVVVKVEELEVHSQEQEQALVAALTEALERIASTQRENIHIIMHDVASPDWGGQPSDPAEQPQDSPEEQGGAPVVEDRAQPGSQATDYTLVGSRHFGEVSRVFDLEQPRTTDMPVHPVHQPGFNYFLHRRHEDGYEPEKTGGRSGGSGVIVCTEHSGTHIDAICHQSEGLTLFGGVPVSEAQTPRGFSHGSVEEIPPIVAPGVLLDVAASHGVECLEPGYSITSEDLEDCCEEQGVTIESGSVALVRTGAGRHWQDPERYLAGPGMSASASLWLAERRVSAVGADNMAWDLIGVRDPELGVEIPGHLILLARHGIYIIENLRLEELADAGYCQFTFICAPVKFAGGTGSPVRPLAAVSEFSNRASV